jgi:microcompartment protein CcmK/EutM
MQYGVVRGTVVASQKVKDLTGMALKVVYPCDAEKRHIGDPFVAIDPISARSGDLVLWVGKREASLAIPGAPLANNYPVDAAITGIIDDIS